MNAQPKQSGATLPSPAKLLDSEAGAFAVFGWQNLTIVIWPCQATGSAVRRLARVTESKAREFRDGFSNVHIVKNGAGMPTEEARAGFVQMMEKHSAELACVGTVLLGSGFWVSALQSVTTGMRMISPRSFDHRINNSIDALVSWLPKEHRKRTGASIDPKELKTVIEKAYLQTIGEPIDVPADHA
jgi:hypothetical protein